MGQVLLDNMPLVVAAPFVLALLIGVFGRFAPKLTPWVAALAPALVLFAGIASVATAVHAEDYSGTYLTPPTSEGSLRWLLDISEAIRIGWAVDGLTSVMLLVVGFVALMVVVFSIGYMAGDPGYVRYFALLALFTGSMTVLVVADGLVGLFIGWELVGACSYLLIGFWFTKPSAAAAAIKAFLTTRVGDVGLLLGIALLWKATGGLTYPEVFANLGAIEPGLVTVIALLLFVGAVGKSAQFPLHIWLPDAMEGPTPVSALIHAATMVAAGVFLIARVWPLFELSETARMAVLFVGAFTALMAATIAVVQTDIKKVLAYSTISQLGFMFAALGAGAWVAAMFHLVTHAFFKALLFLGSGSVIHGCETQDMRRMGGLAKAMPVTAITWLVGAGALAGVPPLAGFFSKDEVIHGVLSQSPVAGGALVVASLLTAFYITRATMLTFAGEYRGTHHPHEGGWVMRIPLLALALLAAGAGFFGHSIAEAMGQHGESLDLLTAAVSVSAALLGIGAGYGLYRDALGGEDRLRTRLGGAWPVLEHAYGYDTAINRIVVRPTVALAWWLYDVLDRRIVDGLAEGTGQLATALGRGVSRMQFGDTQWYASLIGAGFVLVAVLSIVDLGDVWTLIKSVLGVG